MLSLMILGHRGILTLNKMLGLKEKMTLLLDCKIYVRIIKCTPVFESM